MSKTYLLCKAFGMRNIFSMMIEVKTVFILRKRDYCLKQIVKKCDIMLYLCSIRMLPAFDAVITIFLPIPFSFHMHVHD